MADLRAAVFRHLTSLDPAFFDQTKSGEIVSRLTADTTQVKAAFGVSISIALRNVFLFLGAVALMVVTSPKLSALVLLAIPVIVLPAGDLGPGRAAALAGGAGPAGRRLRLCGRGGRRGAHHAGLRHGERHGASRFAAAAEEAFEAARRVDHHAGLPYRDRHLPDLGQRRRRALVRRAGRAGGTMTAGQLSQFVLYAVFAASSLGQLSEVYGELAQAAGAAERLGEILAAEPAIVAPRHRKPLPRAVARHGGFEDVRFAYPTRGRAALRSTASRFAVASGRAGGHGRAVGGRQEHRPAAAAALLRSAGRQILVDGVPVAEADPAGAARPHGPGAAGADDLRRERARQHPLWPPRGRGGGCATGRPSWPRPTASSGPCRRATTP